LTAFSERGLSPGRTLQQPVRVVPIVPPLRSVQNVQSQNSEAKKRFGLCVLDYAVTTNHIHLLVKVYGQAVVQSSRFNGSKAHHERGLDFGDRPVLTIEWNAIDPRVC
jgi:hypothetical protein